MKTRLFTSESVTEGHPDKIADQISDAVLDAILTKDPEAHVACETLVTTGLVIVAGEIRTNAYVDIQKTARETIRAIGYDRAKYGFDCDTCGVLVAIDEQSPDIAQGVDEAKEHEQGAGDQGMMFGYATNETENYLPLPIDLAHKLTRRLAVVRKEKIVDYILPDGKSQVTVEYTEDGKVKRVHTVVISTQHKRHISYEQIKSDVIKHVIEPVLGNLVDKDTVYHINPTGKFEVGGPQGDTGLTGRKIIVDTYGGMGRHGGGCFSGKDPSKVDRSGAYAARYIAKNLVAAGLADRAEVQLAYAIGVAEPVSVRVDTFGTGKLPEVKIEELVRQVFPLKPAAIIEKLDLKKPVYKATAAYGHFGRAEFSWEKLDKVDKLKKLAQEL